MAAQPAGAGSACRFSPGPAPRLATRLFGRVRSPPFAQAGRLGSPAPDFALAPAAQFPDAGGPSPGLRLLRPAAPTDARPLRCGLPRRPPAPASTSTAARPRATPAPSARSRHHGPTAPRPAHRLEAPAGCASLTAGPRRFAGSPPARVPAPAVAASPAAGSRAPRRVQWRPLLPESPACATPAPVRRVAGSRPPHPAPAHNPAPAGPPCAGSSPCRLPRTPPRVGGRPPRRCSRPPPPRPTAAPLPRPAAPGPAGSGPLLRLRPRPSARFGRPPQSPRPPVAASASAHGRLRLRSRAGCAGPGRLRPPPPPCGRLPLAPRRLIPTSSPRPSVTSAAPGRLRSLRHPLAGSAPTSRPRPAGSGWPPRARPRRLRLLVAAAPGRPLRPLVLLRAGDSH
nr:basic proline-rich protein-like [Aegilops tauschii subsp. strangulata]